MTQTPSASERPLPLPVVFLIILGELFRLVAERYYVNTAILVCLSTLWLHPPVNGKKPTFHRPATEEGSLTMSTVNLNGDTTNETITAEQAIRMQDSLKYYPSFDQSSFSFQQMLFVVKIDNHCYLFNDTMILQNHLHDQEIPTRHDIVLKIGPGLQINFDLNYSVVHPFCNLLDSTTEMPISVENGGWVIGAAWWSKKNMIIFEDTKQITNDSIVLPYFLVKDSVDSRNGFKRSYSGKFGGTMFYHDPTNYDSLIAMKMEGSFIGVPLYMVW